MTNRIAEDARERDVCYRREDYGDQSVLCSAVVTSFVDFLQRITSALDEDRRGMCTLTLCYV